MDSLRSSVLTFPRSFSSFLTCNKWQQSFNLSPEESIYRAIISLDLTTRSLSRNCKKKCIYIYIRRRRKIESRVSSTTKPKWFRSRHWSGGNAGPTFVVSNSGNVFKSNDPSFYLFFFLFIISPRLFSPMLLRDARYFWPFYRLFRNPLFTASK